MDRTNLSQNWDRWRALVNAGMNVWVPLNAGNFLACWGLCWNLCKDRCIEKEKDMSKFELCLMCFTHDQLRSYLNLKK